MLISMRVWVRVSVFACIYTYVFYRHDLCVCDGLDASVNGCVNVSTYYFCPLRGDVKEKGLEKWKGGGGINSLFCTLHEQVVAACLTDPLCVYMCVRVRVRVCVCVCVFMSAREVY